MDPTFRHKFGRQMTTLSAATLLLMSAPAFSQSTSPQQVDPAGQASGNKITQDFSQVDKNQDQKLTWDEVESELREPLSQANLNEEQVLSRFDRDSNNSLDEEEFRLLVSELGQNSGQPIAQTTPETQGAQQGSQESEVVVDAQQPRIAVEQQRPQVQVNPAEPDVSVQQRPPEVAVQQQKPEVSVEQQKPKVIVKQPEPEVSVNVPDPEVQVIQPDPDVSVQQPEPDVQVQQQPPEVAIQQGQPDVQVQQPEPQVSVQPATPEVVMEQPQQQAEVQVDQPERADVQVQQAEPDVQVTQAEPEVNVQRPEGADVDVQEIERMEAPAAGIPAETDPQVQQAQSAETDPLQGLSIAQLEEQRVVNANGEEVGEVDQVVIRQDRSEIGVTVSTGGGFFGMGGDRVLIPLDDLSLQNNQLVWSSATDPAQVEQAGQYDPQEYQHISPNEYQTIGDVEKSIQQ